MKDIVFIIPYFGKFNNYFQLFLNSCKHNQNCDWLIFTDDKTGYIYPDNVKVYYCDFDDIKRLFQSKLDYTISLEYPYKLCDYKPAYGYIFQEYLKDYRFWGHCDTDMIWGDISKFVSQKDMAQYDKIGVLGHCTLYKNDKDVNSLFMKTLNGTERSKTVFTGKRNYSFDEEFNQSINNIFEEYNYTIRYEEYEANIYTKSSDFKITRMNQDRHSYTIEKKKNGFFIYNNGKIYRYFLETGIVKQEEYQYIHLQSRPMALKISSDREIYKIIPNAFEDLEFDTVNKSMFNKIKKKNFNLHYFKLRSKNLYKKIQKRLMDD